MNWGSSEVEDCWGQSTTRTLFIKLQSGSLKPLLDLASTLAVILAGHVEPSLERIHPPFIIDHPGLPSARSLLSLFS